MNSLCVICGHFGNVLFACKARTISLASFGIVLGDKKVVNESSTM
jgi:hypothetical protein